MTTPSPAARSRWLPFGTPSADEPRLFLFPHAGASAAAFASWQRLAGDGIAVCPVQPPGRAERFRETAHREVGPFVDDLLGELGDQFTGNYVLFGHSMGALVAFELTRRLRASGAQLPAHLFVSGRPAPQLPEVRTPLRDQPVDQLVQSLRRIGGTPDLLLNDRELLDAFLPLLRADFSVNETYRYTDEEPLRIPLTAFGGERDPRAGAPEIKEWAAQTSVQFEHRIFPGGHFFTDQYAGELVETMRTALVNS
ncbi:thioesterase II family protein [Actinophytocola oryzae]|uniref:Medium-chain acyl-[acyl-carrier-protein] hydrolase n=1 Tax=Actinophytocola oryzae TaxID=502181 RepID=A0A4V3FUQ5_9PSEU|nr:alpha/beta fold hydrolase [Actinophytocola oryzae]TDV56131.1 medium-chain acyl-[acyl-carrier-protein] hydrolase [Actinophytocola oryzae]